MTWKNSTFQIESPFSTLSLSCVFSPSLHSRPWLLLQQLYLTLLLLLLWLLLFPLYRAAENNTYDTKLNSIFSLRSNSSRSKTWTEQHEMNHKPPWTTTHTPLCEYHALIDIRHSRYRPNKHSIQHKGRYASFIVLWLFSYFYPPKRTISSSPSLRSKYTLDRLTFQPSLYQKYLTTNLPSTTPFNWWTQDRHTKTSHVCLTSTHQLHTAQTT